MVTSLFQRGLQGLYEAESLSGVDGDAVTSFTDLSGNGRHLTASSSKPVINTPAVNGKKSIQWDGSKNPLAYTGSFTIRCGWLVVKHTGNFNNPYEGILSGISSFGILVGNGDTNTLFDFQYGYYEYRLNDKIYSPVVDQYGVRTFSPPGPSGWSIIFFKFWQNLTLEGIQIGQDRNFSDRKFTGEVALLALYDRDFEEKEVRINTDSIANSYQLPVFDTFPFQSSKTDQSTIAKVVLSDNQFEPITRVKDDSKESYSLSFNDRDEGELGRAVSFWKSHFPSTRFLFRDYQIVPPRDLNVRFTSEIQKSGTQVNRLNYGFSVIESAVSAPTFIPAAPTIPDDAAPIVELTGGVLVGSSLEIAGTASDASGFTLQLYLNGVAYGSPLANTSPFTFDIALTDLSSGSNLISVLGTDSNGNSSLSNTLTFDGTPDPFPPDIPEGLRLSGASATEFLAEWLPAADEEAGGADSPDDYLLIL